MKNVKNGLRLLVMLLLLILAVFGIGLTGNFLNPNRERYMDREIKTEQVEKKDENEEEDKVKM
jgi:hypothetical protein